MNKIELAKKFYASLAKIPDSQWTVGTYHSHSGDAHCVLGHCTASPEVKAIAPANTTSINLMYDILGDPVGINDDREGRNPYKQETTPKGRILAALKTVIGTEEHNEKAPELKRLDTLIARSHGTRKAAYIRKRAAIKAVITRNKNKV